MVYNAHRIVDISLIAAEICSDEYKACIYKTGNTLVLTLTRVDVAQTGCRALYLAGYVKYIAH